MMMPAITEVDEASPSAIMSGTPTPVSIPDRQRTTPRSEEGATSSGFPEANNVKRRRRNGLCDNRSFQISQIQQC